MAKNTKPQNDVKPAIGAQARYHRQLVALGVRDTCGLDEPRTLKEVLLDCIVDAGMGDHIGSALALLETDLEILAAAAGAGTVDPDVIQFAILRAAKRAGAIGAIHNCVTAAEDGS